MLEKEQKKGSKQEDPGGSEENRGLERCSVRGD